MIHVELSRDLGARARRLRGTGLLQAEVLGTLSSLATILPSMAVESTRDNGQDHLDSSEGSRAAMTSRRC